MEENNTLSGIEYSQSPPTTFEGPGAGFWIRVLARLIDFLFGMFVLETLISALISLISSGLEMLRAIDPLSMEQSSLDYLFSNPGLLLLNLCLYYGGATLYHTVCESLYGATLGKLICRLRVLSEDGRSCSFPAALWRNVAFYLDAQFYGLVGYISMRRSTVRQRFGDKWAKTMVVPVTRLSQDQRKPGELFLLAFGAGCLLWSLCIALMLIITLS